MKPHNCDLAAKGRSCKAIREHLTALGIPALGLATEWTDRRVRDIIRNPVYKGVYSWGKRRVVKLDAEARRGRKPMTRSNGRFVFYYRRQRRKEESRDHLCTCVRGNDLEAAVKEVLTRWARHPGEAVNELQRQMGSQESAQRLREEVHGLEAALSRNAAEVDRVNQRYFKGRMSEMQLDKYLRQTEDDKNTLERQLAEARGAAEDATSNAERLHGVGTLLATLRANIERGMSFEEWRATVNDLVETIMVFPPAQRGQKPVVKVRFLFAPDATRIQGYWASHASLAPAVKPQLNVSGQRLSGGPGWYPFRSMMSRACATASGRT